MKRPPSKWLRSTNGTPALVTTTRRAGVLFYRLRYSGGTLGSQLWTFDELLRAGVRWLKNKPRDWRKSQ